jgi:hypothetical protein
MLTRALHVAICALMWCSKCVCGTRLQVMYIVTGDLHEAGMYGWPLLQATASFSVAVTRFVGLCLRRGPEPAAACGHEYGPDAADAAHERWCPRHDCSGCAPWCGWAGHDVAYECSQHATGQLGVHAAAAAGRECSCCSSSSPAASFQPATRGWVRSICGRDCSPHRDVCTEQQV